MTTTIKRALSLLLCAALLFCAAPLTTVLAEEEPTSGTCGENLTWNYDAGTKTLTISGTGEMNNYDYTDFNGIHVTTAPWRPYYQTMQTLVIGSGVSSIGNCAFDDCTSLTSVTIPTSVTSIGNSAFCGCTGLTSVTIPASVTSIGNYAFAWCPSLTSVIIGNSVTSIGDWAFAGCNSLTSVTIPDSVTSIGDSAFRDCTSLTSVTIPDSVMSIVGSAFDNTAYYNDSANWENNVLYISNHLIKAKESVSGTYEIKPGTKYIGDDAFAWCEGLTSVSIPDSVTSIGSSAFYDCTGLTSVTITDLTAWCGISFSGTYSNPLYYTHNLYLNDELITDLVIPASVTSIGDDAFEYCTGLTSVTIPDSVTSIGGFAFCGCTGLTSVTIPNSVTSIGNDAFCGCTGLTSVTIPNSVTSIGDNAFDYCTGLTSVVIPDSVTSIGYAAFVYCLGLMSVTIPDSVTCIGDGAFDNCTSLTTITVATDNLNYSSDSFGVLYNKDKIELIQYPIGNARTFFVIPDSVTSIGSSAFSGCDGLTKVTIPQSVMSIDETAFYGCSDKMIILGYSDSYAQAFANENNITFVALDLVKFTVTYNANGGTDAPENQTKQYGQPLTLSSAEPTRKDYLFIGWNTAADGSGAAYAPSTDYDDEADLTLYAMWRYNPILVKTVSLDNVILDYKAKTTLKPTITATEGGGQLTVKYESSDPNVAAVNDNGKVTGMKRGSATITVTVTDAAGNTVKDTCTVTVKYTVLQWIIIILLFGWLWY